jgi:hypothetical protein
MGPRLDQTYKMARLEGSKNCNGRFLNRRIVVLYFRNAKIVMVWIKITQERKICSKKKRRGEIVLAGSFAIGPCWAVQGREERFWIALSNIPSHSMPFLVFPT